MLRSNCMLSLIIAERSLLFAAIGCNASFNCQVLKCSNSRQPVTGGPCIAIHTPGFLLVQPFKFSTGLPIRHKKRTILNWLQLSMQCRNIASQLWQISVLDDIFSLDLRVQVFSLNECLLHFILISVKLKFILL